MTATQAAAQADQFWSNTRDLILSQTEKLGQENNQKLKERFPTVHSEDRANQVNEWFKQRLREAFNEALRQLGHERTSVIAHPTSTLAHFLDLFCETLVLAVQAADATELYTIPGWSEKILERMVEEIQGNVATLKELNVMENKPHQATTQAIQQGEWERAEQIVRGSLAVDSTDLEMINNLFTIGCLSGNPQCIVDARNMGESLRQNNTAQPGALTTHHMQMFLADVLLENLLVGSASENRSAGGILLPGPPQPPPMHELEQLSEEVREQAAQVIHDELGKSAPWTVDGFLMMCRRVVTETCQRKAALRGMLIKPWFKGDPNPVPEQFRDRVQTIEKFD